MTTVMFMGMISYRGKVQSNVRREREVQGNLVQVPRVLSVESQAYVILPASCYNNTHKTLCSSKTWERLCSQSFYWVMIKYTAWHYFTKIPDSKEKSRYSAQTVLFLQTIWAQPTSFTHYYEIKVPMFQAKASIYTEVSEDRSLACCASMAFLLKLLSGITIMCQIMAF